MTKDQIFALNMRAVGFTGTDKEFAETAVTYRMAIRLEVEFQSPVEFFIASLVAEVWEGMLDNRLAAMLN